MIRQLYEIHESLASKLDAINGRLSPDRVFMTAGGSDAVHAPPRPWPPRLRGEIVPTGGRMPLWADADGNLYGRRASRTLVMSGDGWETIPDVHNFGVTEDATYIHGIRRLDNGELLIAIYNDQAADVAGEVWRSTGFDPADPTAAVWTKVLTTVETGARIHGRWGMSHYDNLVLLSEYGTHGQARHVYLSTDYAETFNVVFEGPTTAGGGGFHVHGTALDPYRGWIWMCTGDASNGSIRVKRGIGDEPWEVISTDHQSVSIAVMPDCVLYLTDSGPNGVYRVRIPSNPSGELVLEPAFLFDTDSAINLVGAAPYRSPGANGVTWLPFYGNRAGQRGRILATRDGFDIREVWADWNATPGTGGVTEVVGPVHGKMIALLMNTGREDYYNILMADAPEWA